MTIYVPVATLDTSYDIPDDGDEADAASVNVVFEALADGLEYISGKIVRISTGSVSDDTTGRGSTNSTSYTAVDTINIPGIPDDAIVRIWYSALLSGTGQALLKMTLGGVALQGGYANSTMTTGGTQITMIASGAISTGGNLDLVISGKTPGGTGLSISNPFSLIIEIEAP